MNPGLQEPPATEVRDPQGRLVARLAPSEWESRFFGRSIAALSVAGADALRLGGEEWRRVVAQLAAAADGQGYRLVQLHLDVRHLGLAPAVEEAGFRLVDTRINFVTRVDRRRVPRFEPSLGTLRLAGPADLADLFALADQGLTENPAFHSRYKDRAYFTPEESARWFRAWVENDLADPESLVAVWHVEAGLAGFVGLGRRGDREGLPVYKGTLSVVQPPWQGRQGHLTMLTFLYDHLSVDEFWMESATQLTNPPIFRNHLVTGKRVDRVELTFFRTPPH